MEFQVLGKVEKMFPSGTYFYSKKKSNHSQQLILQTILVAKGTGFRFIKKLDLLLMAKAMEFQVHNNIVLTL